MSIEKIITVDKIEVLEDGRVAVRTKSAFVENGVEAAATWDVRLIAPGDDYSGEDARVQAICAATHTPEVLAVYQGILGEQAASEAGE